MDTRTAELFFEALTTEKANIETYKSQLGFSDAQIDECIHDHANLAAGIANVQIADADKQSVTKLKNNLYDGNPNEALNPYPSFTMTALPFPAMKAGALSRYNNRKRQGKLSADYTSQIGLAMGYETSPADSITPNTVKAIIEAVSSAAVGYTFGIIVSNRAKSDMWEVQIKRKGSDTWQTIGSATGKSADFTVTATTQGEAEQIEVRVLLKKANQIYGQPSDPTYLTLNP
jgi:hypothetical protein